MSEYMLEMRNVSLTFGKGTVNEKTALRNLNLNVKKGDFISIIGANGAGKSTLFNAISGVYLADEGTVLLDGKDITMTEEYKRSRVIGRLFQNTNLGTAPGMSILENLSLAAGRGGWLSTIKKKDREFFREKLKLLNMGLEDRLEHPVGLLSGGQRQALTLLMATINPPKLLLLDEHTAALDPTTAEKVLELTESIVREENLTCLMVTHNMGDALRLGNRTIMMNDGAVIYDTEGPDRACLSVADLLDKFKEAAGEALDNDRMMLGNVD